MERNPFCKGEFRDNLLIWAGKLNALGAMVGDLAFHKADALEVHGQYIGWIISDYAELIDAEATRALFAAAEPPQATAEEAPKAPSLYAMEENMRLLADGDLSPIIRTGDFLLAQEMVKNVIASGQRLLKRLEEARKPRAAEEKEALAG